MAESANRPTAGGASAADAIRRVLESFEAGYRTRDMSLLDDFLDELFVPNQDLLLIGTGADEWRQGRGPVKELIAADWEAWGDLDLDLEGALITVMGDVAWLATRGTVTGVIEAEDFQEGQLEVIRQVLDGKGAAEERLLEILRGTANTLFETARGDVYVWPLRLSAVLVHRAGRWLFYQMQLSHATTHVPDERIVLEAEEDEEGEEA